MSLEADISLPATEDSIQTARTWMRIVLPDRLAVLEGQAMAAIGDLTSAVLPLTHKGAVLSCRVVFDEMAQTLRVGIDAPWVRDADSAEHAPDASYLSVELAIPLDDLVPS
ncbi:hypothetical protein [Nonomuraea sp. NPDC050310]|uniref:hypothetical protein n=1 Tax=Nonomuraea sp. NPDC050310 TaxID=3154935 RepID=UPI003408C9AC